MLKKLIKLIPGTTLLNKFLLNKRIQGQFLRLTELERSQLAFYSQFIKKGTLYSMLVLISVPDQNNFLN